MTHKDITKVVLLLLLSVFLLVLSHTDEHLTPLSLRGYKWEKFQPELQKKIYDIPSLLAYADGQADTDRNTLLYFNTLTSTVRKRFYHGYSHYSLSENWIAALAGKFGWNHLSAIVDADDLLRYPMAACSQQSIIIMECCRQSGIPYRPVYYTHHYALEANIGGQWYYADANMEPVYPNGRRTSLQNLIDSGYLATMYRHVLTPQQVKEMLGPPRYGAVNMPVAANARMFHAITKFLSRWLWLWPLLAALGRINKSILSVSLRHVVYPVKTIRLLNDRRKSKRS